MNMGTLNQKISVITADVLAERMLDNREHEIEFYTDDCRHLSEWERPKEKYYAVITGKWDRYDNIMIYPEDDTNGNMVLRQINDIRKNSGDCVDLGDVTAFIRGWLNTVLHVNQVFVTA